MIYMRMGPARAHHAVEIGLLYGRLVTTAREGRAIKSHVALSGYPRNFSKIEATQLSMSIESNDGLSAHPGFI